MFTKQNFLKVFNRKDCFQYFCFQI